VNPSIMAWKPFFAYPNSANPSQFNPIQRRIVGYTLGHLPRLNIAELGYTKITDRGIAKLRDFPNLGYVFLWGTRITDRSVDTLVQMPWLRLVNVSHTDMTKHGFDRLRQSLDNCLVSHIEFGTMFQDTDAPESYAAWIDSG